MDADEEKIDPSGETPAPPRWFGIALIGLSLGVGAVIAELGVRGLWHNPFRNEATDSLVRVRFHHPHRDIAVDRRLIDPERPTAAFRTDARGYIEPSRRFEAPDLTIAFLGGSTTECIAIDEEQRFPALVSTLLERRGLRVNVLNAGRSGNTSHDSLNVFLNHVADDRPDVAVMMHAANDIGMLWRAGSYRPRSGEELSFVSFGGWLLQEASARSWLAAAFRHWLTIGEAVQGDFENRANLEREKDRIDPQPFARRLGAFAGLARAFDVEPVLMTQPAITMVTRLTPGWMDARNQEVFNQVIRGVAERLDVPLVDLAAHLAENVDGWNEPMKVFYDGIHVTALGSQIYAEQIVEVLWKEVLPRLEERADSALPSAQWR